MKKESDYTRKILECTDRRNNRETENINAFQLCWKVLKRDFNTQEFF